MSTWTAALVSRRLVRLNGQAPLRRWGTTDVSPASVSSSSSSSSSPAEAKLVKADSEPEGEEEDALDVAYKNVSTVVARALKDKDPDDINLGKLYASAFVEKYSNAYSKLPAERKAKVEARYGERVAKLKADLLTLFRFRTFND